MSFVAPSSTIPTVKAYLVTTIAGRSEITATASTSPVLVSYGEPGTYQPLDVIAVLDSVQRFDVMAMVGSGGTHWLSESFDLEVVVDCFLGGDDPQAVEERALYLASVVVDVVRTDPSLGGLVIVAQPAAMRTEGAWEDEHKGRRGRVFVTLHVETQL